MSPIGSSTDYSVYSSTSGVVLPAFLPIVPELAERLGGLDPAADRVVDERRREPRRPFIVVEGRRCSSRAPRQAPTRASCSNGLLAWDLSMTLVGAVLCHVLFG